MRSRLPLHSRLPLYYRRRHRLSARPQTPAATDPGTARTNSTATTTTTTTSGALIDLLLAPLRRWHPHEMFLLDAAPTSRSDVNVRFRALACLVHPDKVPHEPRAGDAFKVLAAARDSLLAALD